MTPEQIEALDPSQIIPISQLANELHAATPGILDSMLNARDVDEQMALRTAMQTKLKEAKSELDKRIADLEALKRELGIRASYQTSDLKRLKSHVIGLYIKEKELRTRP